MKHLAPLSVLLLAVAGCRDSGSSKAPAPTQGGLSAAPVTSDRGGGVTVAPTTSSTPAVPATAVVSAPAAPPADTQAPEIEILEPSRGLATPDATVRLVARVRDASGIDTVMLNGTPVPVRGDRIEATVPLEAGLNLLEVQAIDGAGNLEQAVVPVLGGEFLPADRQVPRAVEVRLNDDAFTKISQVVSRKLGGADLERAIKAKNPLVDDSKGLAKLQLNATGFENGAPRLTLTPTRQGLVAQARIPNLKLTSKVKGKVTFVPFGSTVKVSATEATLGARVAVGVNRAGKVTTALRDVSVSRSGFKLDIKWVPGFLENLARNKVRKTIETKVAEQLNAALAPALQDAIAGRIKPIRRRILGHTIDFTVRPDAVSVDDRGLSLTLDMNLGVPVPAGTQVPSSPGSLFVPVTQAPAIDAGASFELSAHTNLLNRIAHTVWQGGLVNLDLDPETVDKLNLSPTLKLDAFMLSVIFPELTNKLGDPATPAKVTVDLGMPPVFETAGNRGLTLSAGDVTISLWLTPPGQPEQLVARLGLQVEATLESEIREQRFHTQVVGMPSARIDAFEHPIVPLSSLGMQNLLDVLLPELLKHQTKLLTGFPLPTVPLVTPKQVELQNDPRSPGYLDLSGRL